jgi:hypothetical protein
LRSIPRVVWAPETGIRVLGFPVEHPASTSFRKGEVQSAVDRLEEACHVLTNLGDPHEEHILLRYCLDACRVMHFLRAIETDALNGPLQAAQRVIRKTWDDILGQPAVSDAQWEQCCLPLRMAGLGVKDPITLQAPARIAGIISAQRRCTLLRFPQEASVLPRDFVAVAENLQGSLGRQFSPLDEWVEKKKATNIEDEHASQKWWTDKVHQARKASLKETLPVRDRCRLRLQSMPHTSSWMQTVPNKGIGMRVGASKYRLLLRWWLGAKLLSCAGGPPCPLCGDALDPFGDHLLCCKKNKLVQRHNAVRDALALVLKEKGVHTRTEVAIGGKTRPADVAFDGVDPTGPLAVDLVVFHPLRKGLA